MWKWSEKNRAIKKDLFSFKDEPLTRLSVFLLMVLNVFIFTNVLIGVHNEIDKVPKPRYYFSTYCSNHFENIKTSYEGFERSVYMYRSKEYRHSEYCQELQKKIDFLEENKIFQTNLERIGSINNKKRLNNAKLEEIAKKYNTRLFESIAKMPNNHALIDVKNEYDILVADNKKLDEELKAIIPVSTIVGYDEYIKFIEDNRSDFFKAKSQYIFWQPFKAYAHMLLFILPLLLFFGFFYARAKRQELTNKEYNPVVKIISANVSLILSLPLIWYTLTLIYHVLPKTLLKKIIAFLVEHGLISLLNYFTIILIIATLGGVIYYIQKRTIRLKKSAPDNQKQLKLISHSQCFACGYRIDYEKEHCPFCGTKLHESCPSCSEKTVVNEPYCSSCGEKKGVVS